MALISIANSSFTASRRGLSGGAGRLREQGASAAAKHAHELGGQPRLHFKPRHYPTALSCVFICRAISFRISAR